MSVREATEMSLGLRVDRWSLLILTAVVLGCHYFDQITHALGIGPKVLSRRLSDMVEARLLQCETDAYDARRRLYRLTPSSRDLFGYIVCLSNWASESHLHEPSSIRPRHRACQHSFSPKVACDHCHQGLNPWEVSFPSSNGKNP